MKQPATEHYESKGKVYDVSSTVMRASEERRARRQWRRRHLSSPKAVDSIKRCAVCEWL
jgi:hypothetical protein